MSKDPSEATGSVTHPMASYEPSKSPDRSSVFKRRSSILLSAPPVQLSDVARHKQYTEEAKAEMAEWTKLFEMRRSESRSAANKLKELKANNPELDLEDAKKYLDEKDLEILSSRPDYSRINRDVNKFLINAEMLKKKFEMLHSTQMFNDMAAQAHLKSMESSLSSYNCKHPDWLQSEHHKP